MLTDKLEPPRVVVTDVQMRFWSMVCFMVKWVIATIPAIVILWVILWTLKILFFGVIIGSNKGG